MQNVLLHSQIPEIQPLAVFKTDKKQTIMKSENFFHFVHSLTKTEKAAFSRYTKNSKKFLDILLYDRILKEKEFSPEAEERIRGVKLKDSSKYFFYRIKLGKKILLTLVLLEGKDVSIYALIKKALEKDVIELANKILGHELEKLNKAEDFLGIKHLLEYCGELEHRYKDRFDFGKFDSRLNDFILKAGRISYLRSILDGIRNAFLLNEEEKFSITQSLEKDISGFVPACVSERFLHLKSKVGIAILRRNYLESFRLQKKLVEILSLEFAIVSEIVLVHERSQLIRFGLQIGEKDFALKQIFDLRQVELQEDGGRTSLLKQLVILQIDIGEQYGNLQLVKNGIALLTQNKQLFSPNGKIREYFFSALAFLYNSEYEVALKLLRRVQEIPHKHRTDITWEPEAVKLLIIIEAGKVDEYESAYRGAYRSASKIEKDYPAMVVSTLKAYSSMDNPRALKFLEKKLPEVQLTKLKPRELRTSKYWDFTQWMKSKIQSYPYHEVIRQEYEKEVLYNREINFG